VSRHCGPQDRAHHTLLHATVPREDWQLWLTAAGLPVSLETRRGLSFDQSFMAVQAAVEDLVSRSATRFVEADGAGGRFVVPAEQRRCRSQGRRALFAHDMARC
jgi:LysR family glycine cleavage system transcriptional activator